MQGEHQMNIKAEVRVMCLQTKGWQRLPANHQKRKEHGPDSASQSSKATNPDDTFISDF